MNYKLKRSISCILLVIIIFTLPMYSYKKAYATGLEMSNIYATYEEVVELIEMITLSAAGYSIKYVAEKSSEGKWKLKETGKELLERAGYINEQREEIIAYIKKMCETNTGAVVDGLGETLSAILSSKIVQGLADTLHQLFIEEYSTNTEYIGKWEELVCKYSYTYVPTGITYVYNNYTLGRSAVIDYQNGYYGLMGKIRQIFRMSNDGFNKVNESSYPKNVVTYSIPPNADHALNGVEFICPIFVDAGEASKYVNGIGTLNDYEYIMPEGTILDPETTRPVYYPHAYPDAQVTLPENATDVNSIIDYIEKNGIDGIVGTPVPIPEPVPKEELEPNPNPGQDTSTGGLFETLWEWLQRILEAIKAIPINIFNLLQQSLQKIINFLSSILDLLDSIPGAIWDLFTNTLQGILNILNLIYEFIKNMLSSIFKVTITNFEELINLLSAFLPGILEDIFNLPMLALQKLLKELFVELFVPDMEALKLNMDKLKNDFNLKFPIIGQIFLIIGAFVKGPESNMPDFVMYPYGVRVRLVEFDWFMNYLDVIHGIVIAICWYQFISRTYKKLPGIIGGFNGL